MTRSNTSSQKRNPSRVNLREMRWTTLLLTGILLLALLSISACARTGPGKPVHDYCRLTNYILVGDADQITEETEKEILEHNVLRKRLCG